MNADVEVKTLDHQNKDAMSQFIMTNSNALLVRLGETIAAFMEGLPPPPVVGNETRAVVSIAHTALGLALVKLIHANVGPDQHAAFIEATRTMMIGNMELEVAHSRKARMQ